MCGWLVRGQRGKQGQGCCVKDSVLYNFLKQNCLFEFPKTFAEERLQSPPQNVPEGGCIYSPRGFHTADAAERGAGEGPPVVLPLCLSLRLGRPFAAGKALWASVACVFLLVTAKEAVC